FAAALSIRAVFRRAAFDTGAIAADSGSTARIRSALDTNMADTMVTRWAICIHPATGVAVATRAILTGGAVLRGAALFAGSVATDAIGAVRVGTAFDAGIVDAAQSFRTVVVCFTTSRARATGANLPLWTISILTASGADSIAAHTIRAIHIGSAFETAMV